MIVPQLVELDVFLKALQGRVAGELLEAGDVDALGDAARDRAAPQAVPGECRRIELGKTGPVLDDQRDRIGVDRIGTNPVAVGCRLSLSRRRRATHHPRAGERRSGSRLVRRTVAGVGAGGAWTALPGGSRALRWADREMCSRH